MAAAHVAETSDDALGVSAGGVRRRERDHCRHAGPAVPLDRAGRVLHLNAAAAQLAPALRVSELAQFALRKPEIVTALREAIATAEPRRVTYLDHVPVDRWMELIIAPVGATVFGGTESAC